jgi:hypothetical protein
MSPSFLKGNHDPSISSCHFDMSHWRLEKKNDSEIYWLHRDHPTSVTLLFVAERVPLRLNDVAALRIGHREGAAKDGGALLYLDTFSKGKLRYMKLFVKYPMQPHGCEFIGTLLFPLARCYYLVKVSADDRQPTGLREAIMYTQLNLPSDEWFADPYDKTIKLGFMANRGDSEEYDDLFPDHALTFARKELARIEREIQFDETVLKSEPFEPGTPSF